MARGNARLGGKHVLKVGIGRQLLEDCLGTAATRVRPSTLLGYRSKINGTIVPEIGHVKVQVLDGLVLNRFYASRLKGSATRRALAPATVRQMHAILCRALRDAER